MSVLRMMPVMMVPDLSEPSETTQPTATSPTTGPALDFDAVYREGYPATLRRARSLLHGGNSGRAAGQNTEFAGDGWLPEDIAQEVWTRLWRRWGSLQQLSRAQVMGTARQATDHLIIDRYRYRKLAAQHGRTRLDDEGWMSVERTQAAKSEPTDLLLDDDDGHELICDQPESALLWREMLAELRAVVRSACTASQNRDDKRTSLTYAQRDALFEALLTGESPRSVSTRLGMSEGSVKTHQWRTRVRLRAYLLDDAARGGDDDEADEGEEAQAV